MTAIPTALWGYASLRALAFAAPAWSEGGRIGLGAIAIAALFFQVVRRRSRRAWQWLLFLDILSAALLAAAWSTNTGAAVAAPVLALLALGCLVLPSSRGYVDA
ncbi:MAG: hypothetical protein AAGA90_22760 [Actinomycetota bacterium]